MKPTIPKKTVNAKIREVLAMASGYGKTEGLILQSVNDLTGGGVTLQEIRNALEWNLSQNFVRSEYDSEDETTVWFMTAGGTAKQNLSK